MNNYLALKTVMDERAPVRLQRHKSIEKAYKIVNRKGIFFAWARTEQYIGVIGRTSEVIMK